ncbi:hypothetical protein M3B76_008210 [Micrococcus luteus]|nr:hypothetical protein [Micrococcus luteus]
MNARRRPSAAAVAEFVAVMRDRHGLDPDRAATATPSSPVQPALLNADGTPAAPLPTTTPEAE